ncbi:MAG TPA: hypothetical protein VFQ12_02530 [Thermoleophilaceae bacterium]|nr:hypothetical protein [Thermoleophilaceae bacterium]
MSAADGSGNMSGLPVQSIGTPPRGITPPTTPGGRPGFLSDVIVELGFADRATVETAVRTARSPGTTVARVLVDSGAINEEQLAHATAERHGLPYVDLAAYAIDPATANLLTPVAARRHRCVAVGFSGPRLVLAIADPADAPGKGQVPELGDLDVLPAVASASAIEALTARLPLPHPGGQLAAVVVDAPSAEPEPAPAPEQQPAPAPEDETDLRAQLARAEARLQEAERRTRDQQHELATARTEVEARTVELEVLRTKVASEERRRRRLEDRLLEVEGGMFAAERAAEELREAQRRMRSSLSGLDRPDPPDGP